MNTEEERRRLTESEPSARASGESVDPSPPSMRVVGIGASAGGLGALKKLFARVPEQSGVCFVVVVHLSAEHESHLAPLLQVQSPIPVQQVTEATPLEANHVYVIPPGANIDAIDTHLRLSDLESKRQERAPIDHFFRTLAEAHQEQAVGVVLTGTGSDGTAGLRRIRERGGLTVVQSPDEAEYDAMPRSAIAAGVADLILPLEQILAHILQIGQAPPQITVSDEGPLPAEHAEGILQKILAHVRTHTGHDFSLYKRSTILRRIRRRMQLHRVEKLDGYLHVLREQDQEVGLLFEDLLITVTEFFRDPEIFAHLESQVIPSLFKDKGPAHRVRAWSVGCATGEEAYSLAMLLIEEEARREVKPNHVQVFASDLHEPALRKAREGIYPSSIEADVSPRRLDQFFIKQNNHYRVSKQVREHIVFALHNILQDTPFSHVQLITCRNLLIYLQHDAQRQLASVFHYALEEDGYLLVGTAEGVESDLFVCENKKLGLYRRRSVPTPKGKPSTFPLTSRRHPSENPPAPQAEPPASFGVLHEQMVERYAPPSVLINPDGELVHYSARAGRYLRLAGGTPTNNFYQLLPEPLRVELRTAIHMARGQCGGYRSRPIDLSLEGQPCQVILRVQPIDQPQMDGFFLVIFDEIEDTGVVTPSSESNHTDASVRTLEVELAQTKKRMQTLIEEHEDAQERAQAYNEELESSNEELRSTMEELETSKEEMQSMNEELTTLNHEIRQKVEELDQLSSDLHGLLTATDIATVFLDNDMRIMRFTPSMAELLDMRESDRGRSLTDLTHRLGYQHLQEDFRRVLDQRAPTEREVRSEQARWYLARLQPYRKVEDCIQGVVITFIDITERKNAEEQIREAKDLAEKIIDTVRSPMLVLDDNLRVQSANEAFHNYFAVQPADIKGTLVYELNGGQWDIPRLREMLEDILPKDETMEDFELEYQFDERDRRSLILNARRIDHVQLILLAIEDITERKQARQTLERSRDELEHQVAQRTAELQQQAARLQLLVRELASAEQRARKRMASVLHDDLQQLLVGLKMRLDMTRSRNKDEWTAKSLGEALRTLDKAIDTTRTLIRQVAPQTLYDDGLIPALRWLGEEMSRRHGLHVQIQAEGTEPVIGDEIKTLLFESIREMLFNVVKHAEVDQATVAVRQADDRLNITVSDEGVGFDVEAKASEDGKSDFGVFSWGNRIEAMGGYWSIDATPGQGTRVHVELPLRTPPADESAGGMATLVAPASPRPSPFKTRGVRVLVVDDHTLVRNGIVTALKLDNRVRVIGEAGDGFEAIAAAEQHQPDVVLMDVNMPRMNGIEATREIGRRWPGMIVVGLSMQNKEDGPARAMSEAGAAAFLSKSDDLEQMIETILRLTHPESRR